jgi:hypothetical protein
LYPVRTMHISGHRRSGRPVAGSESVPVHGGRKGIEARPSNRLDGDRILAGDIPGRRRRMGVPAIEAAPGRAPATIRAELAGDRAEA